MKETTYVLQDQTPYWDMCWETMNFDVYDKQSKQLDSFLIGLAEKLRSGKLDGIWFENSYEKVIWTRSLKQKDAIQVTSFSHKYKTPNGDSQATNYDELLQYARESGIHKGVKLHTVTI